MSVMLVASSFITTLLIPPEKFLPSEGGIPAGEASGRALAYLAMNPSVNIFGSVYDRKHNPDSLVCWRFGNGRIA
jgi:hypothetical protein